MKNIKVVESNSLSSVYEKRYVVIDSNTGEVVDDAQGYGYKTMQKAYAAYHYKHRDKSKDEEKERKRKYIRKWMKENSEFVHLIDTYDLEIGMGKWGKDDKVDAKLVRKMLKENNMEIDFSVGDLLREWRKE